MPIWVAPGIMASVLATSPVGSTAEGLAFIVIGGITLIVSMGLLVGTTRGRRRAVSSVPSTIRTLERAAWAIVLGSLLLLIWGAILVA